MPARLALERLEDRLAPATLSEIEGGTRLLITLDNTGEGVSVVSHGTAYTFATTHTFLDGGVTNPGDFSAFGTDS
jgi:hypothetical protein